MSNFLERMKNTLHVPESGFSPGLGWTCRNKGNMAGFWREWTRGTSKIIEYGPRYLSRTDTLDQMTIRTDYKHVEHIHEASLAVEADGINFRAGVNTGGWGQPDSIMFSLRNQGESLWLQQEESGRIIDSKGEQMTPEQAQTILAAMMTAIDFKLPLTVGNSYQETFNSVASTTWELIAGNITDEEPRPFTAGGNIRFHLNQIALLMRYLISNKEN